jgi:hypothetical protein
MRKAFLFCISSLFLLQIQAQVRNIVYVDISDQGNRTRLVQLVDSVVANSNGPSLVMVSNGSSPVFEYTNLPKDSYQRIIRTSNPSSPSPNFELDTMFTLIATHGGLSKHAKMHFFLGDYNAGGKQQLGVYLLEKFLLVGQLVRDGKVLPSAEVTLYLNPQEAIQSDATTIALSGNFNCSIQGLHKRTIQ